MTADKHDDEGCTGCVSCTAVRPVDVGDLRRRLLAVATLGRYVAEHLDDLGTLAYDVVVGERVGGGGTSEGHAHTSTGDRRAKVALARLDHEVASFARVLGDAERVVTNGPGADVTLRGTMLGDGGGKHPADTLAGLLRNQRDRRDRGEYTPTRIVEQPALPDNRKTSPTRSKAKKRKGKR